MVIVGIDDLKEMFGEHLYTELVTPNGVSMDGIIKRYCLDVSRAFELFVTNNVKPARTFHPRLETRAFDHPVVSRGSGEGSRGPVEATVQGSGRVLRLDDDLLEVDTLTTKNGATTISSSDYTLRRRGSSNITPYDRIVLAANGTVTSFEYDEEAIDANSVTGIWGYHDDYDNAWEDSGDTVQDDPLTAASTTIAVSDADADDVNGLPARFRTQQILRIGSGSSYEFVFVTGVNIDSETLTVRRGMFGTTAIEHNQNTNIYIWRTMPDVIMAVRVLTTHMFRRRDTIGTPDERPLAAAQGILIMPPTLPNEVKMILNQYRKAAL